MATPLNHNSSITARNIELGAPTGSCKLPLSPLCQAPALLPGSSLALWKPEPLSGLVSRIPVCPPRRWSPPLAPAAQSAHELTDASVIAQVGHCLFISPVKWHVFRLPHRSPQKHLAGCVPPQRHSSVPLSAPVSLQPPRKRSPASCLAFLP